MQNNDLVVGGRTIVINDASSGLVLITHLQRKMIGISPKSGDFPNIGFLVLWERQRDAFDLLQFPRDGFDRPGKRAIQSRLAATR